MWRQTYVHEARLWRHFAGTGPYVPLGCFAGLKLVAVFELIGILMESNVPSFFERNMRFLCYSAALYIKIHRFQSQGQA